MASDKDRYQASSHYVWRQEPGDILGEGAFGTVYRGYHKETCEAAAIKTFNKMSLKRPASVQYRELNILEKLDHPNVVKLIAVEELVTHKPQRNGNNSSQANILDGKVLIMELCTEGSLYSIIEQPENQFGLEEAELLRVLGHTTGGMKYLRKNKIVHRDWKPSNILKMVTKEGEVLYKLCDFGAARELDDNQPFFSIVGTEEYIPPDIYGRALLGHSNRNFFATSDLWSFGVTLYHVATGTLPFRPFGGRKNRETMYQIISSKDAGVISGVQEKENGPVVWSRTLPDYCQLSRQCKKFLTDVLAHLLETDQEKQWSFDQFFQSVDCFLSNERVRILLPNLRSEIFYVKSDVKYGSFLDKLIEEFDVDMNEEKSSFFCWWEGRIFNACVIIDEFKISTLARSPVFLTRKHSIDDQGMPDFPCVPSFSNTTDLNADYETSNVCSSLVFWALQKFKQFSSQKDQLVQIAQSVLKSLENRKLVIEDKLGLFKKLTANIELGNELTNTRRGFQSISCSFEAILKRTMEIDGVFSRLIKLTDFAANDLNSLTLLERSVCTIFEISMQFRNDRVMARSSGDLSANELKWHDLQKRQLNNVWKTAEITFRENQQVKSDMQKMVEFFCNASTCNALLNSCEKEMVVLENSILAVNSTFRQELQRILVAKVSGSVLPPQLSSVTLQCLLQDTVNEIRDLRSLAADNRQILSSIQFDN